MTKKTKKIDSGKVVIVVTITGAVLLIAKGYNDRLKAQAQVQAECNADPLCLIVNNLDGIIGSLLTPFSFFGLGKGKNKSSVVFDAIEVDRPVSFLSTGADDTE